ncbi:phage tail protein [Myxococcus sp. K15C18031901]|uniref:phage tail tube protein n=1 Tax=Myxococcus dinghuensis TaxID=2906761 RepID=UPI0020A825FE|nr:phage tail tube protein [Myxococcus dinghuensis]MCP3105533.1 phage tail protein [Myxococcus dinghuensis]
MSAPVAAHLDSVSVRSDATAAQPADRVDGLTDASLSESGDFVETNYLGGSGYKSRVQTLKDTSADLSGHFMEGDAPQAALRDARDTGGTVHVTFIFDPSAAPGAKGKRIPMVVNSYDEKLTPGGVVEFSAKLLGNGAPVAV